MWTAWYWYLVIFSSNSCGQQCSKRPFRVSLVVGFYCSVYDEINHTSLFRKISGFELLFRSILKGPPTPLPYPVRRLLKTHHFINFPWFRPSGGILYHYSTQETSSQLSVLSDVGSESWLRCRKKQDPPVTSIRSFSALRDSCALRFYQRNNCFKYFLFLVFSQSVIAD